MHTNSLPERTYRIKKTELHNLAAILGIIALVVNGILFALVLTNTPGFIPTIQIPLLITISMLTVMVYYSFAPPSYVKLKDRQIQIRRMIIGFWRVIEMQELEQVQVRGDKLYLIPYGKSSREAVIKLTSLYFKDSQELKELLNITT